MTRATSSRPKGVRYFQVLGALTVAVIAAVVYVSYTANDGLPLQHARQLYVDVPNAQRLASHADVRVAGVHVGQVMDVHAKLGESGRVYARLRLRLDRSVGAVPVDSRVQVRSASILGSTFLDLTLGKARATVPADGTLPLRQARTTVQLTDLLDVFDHASARHLQRILGGLGPGLAGRGPSLNRSIAALSDLVPATERVAGTLAAPATRLGPFLDEAAQFTGALAPVASPLAHLIAGGATTFDALAREQTALGRSIEALPGTERSVTNGFDALRPGLIGLARISTRLRPVAVLIPRTFARVNTALVTGLPMLRGLPPFSGHLETAVGALQRLSRVPATSGALRKLDQLMAPANTLLADLTPAQTRCNVIALWARNFSLGGGLGAGNGPSLAGFGVTTKGAENEILQNAKPSANVGINYLPNETGAECESGNEDYAGKQVLNNPPGQQSNVVPDTEPPAGVRARAIRAGLIGQGAGR